MQGSEDALPALRLGLEFMESGRSQSGAPHYLLYDPKTNKYFRLGWREYEILSRWDIAQSARNLLSLLHRELNRTFSPSHITDLMAFLLKNDLLTLKSDEQSKWIAEQREKNQIAERSAWKVKASRLLYWRLKLFDPTSLLNGLVPHTKFLISSIFWKIWALSLFLALGLVATNFEAYSGTFDYLATPAGIFWLFATFMAMKLLHEIGHALIAAHFGIKVPAIGVAFLFLWPVLYTDVTHSWRLPDKIHRVLIDLSGVLTEISLAIVATLLWAFWEDGAVRSVLFVISSTTWVISVLVNINPLMKFDGYYALSDFLDEPNLMTRAQRYRGWRIEQGLHETLLPAPEPYSKQQRRLFGLYSLASLAYRAFIMILVTYGMFLMLPRLLFVPAIAIIWGLAIIIPISRFMGKLYQGRAGWSHRRIVSRLYLPGLLIIALTFIPWQTQGSADAILRAASESFIYSPGSGKVTALHVREGQIVTTGEPLLEITPFDLQNEIDIQRAKLSMLKARLDKIGLEEKATQLNSVIRAEFATTQSVLDGLLQKYAHYKITAPEAGVITALSPALRQGSIVENEGVLMHIKQATGARLFAYVTENDIKSLKIGSEVLFYDTNQPYADSLKGHVVSAPQEAISLADPELATLYGGPIAVREITENINAPHVALQPVNALFRLEIHLTDDLETNRITLGRIRFAKEGHSLAYQLYGAVVRTYYRYFYL